MFSRKQAPVLLARLAGFLAVVLMVAAATANAHTVYSYEKNYCPDVGRQPLH